MSDKPTCRLCIMEADKTFGVGLSIKEGFALGYVTGMTEGKAVGDLVVKSMCPDHRTLLGVSAATTGKALMETVDELERRAATPKPSPAPDPKSN